MTDTGRTIFGGAPSGGLRVPPSSEVGVPLAADSPVAMSASDQVTLEWVENDDTGDPFPAGEVVFDDANEQVTLIADHTGVTPNMDGYYWLQVNVSMTAGGSGVDMEANIPGGDNEYLHLPAGGFGFIKRRMVLPLSGGTMWVALRCIAGSATIGSSTFYIRRLSD